MNTLVIYDTSGTVLSTMSGEEYTLIGTAVIDVPEGYVVSHVNAETGEVILAPKPATEAERTAAIEKQMMAQAGTHEGTYEDPIPFIYGMPTVKGKRYSYDGEIYIWNTADCASCVWLPSQGIWEWKKATEHEAEGTITDPIPASAGMEYVYGKYYLDPADNKTYLCTRAGTVDGETITLYFLPHELVGQYFELV